MSRLGTRPVITMCAATALFLAGAAFTKLASASSQVPDAHLKQLLRDRIGVRKQIVDRFERLRNRGGASQVEVLLSTRDLLWAELDACTTKAERIAVLERIFEHEKKITAFYEKTPDFQEVERLLLRVRLFDAQITLEREKLG